MPGPAKGAGSPGPATPPWRGCGGPRRRSAGRSRPIAGAPPAACSRCPRAKRRRRSPRRGRSSPPRRRRVSEEEAKAYEDPTYHASRSEVGDQRLAEMLEESAFWSAHLLRYSASDALFERARLHMRGGTLLRRSLGLLGTIELTDGPPRVGSAPQRGRRGTRPYFRPSDSGGTLTKAARFCAAAPGPPGRLSGGFCRPRSQRSRSTIYDPYIATRLVAI
jgi:hypothetical protein